MTKLAEKFKKEIRPALQKELGLSNIMATPKIEKVTINIGIGRASQDKQLVEFASSILQRITGQKPVSIKAKKSISNFKLREGMIVGTKVTLRGARMYDFIDRLVNSTIPRFRDFYGLETKKGFDKNGNYIVGLKEHIVFPEIGMEDVERVHGLEICFTTSAKDKKQALALFRGFGFPFKKDKNTKK
ncbi:50S ribosomal protein L5 [Candidatus Parcubacteria bacterium]|jgi:large subunit ribosomal protein L5|nr:50S ribosomal protein L5 [Candidatus Parcubacteria bacterium]MBT7228725.1 50S ribosomal protein L5 [Candidatus Parcubacteria bacterium]